MPNWTKEQEEAIYKDGSNIIVSAGAGSGKTAVLSERVLNKISKGIHVNELLILTFTRAAADEMKERIRKKISKIPKYKEELDKIDSAYITTFDSFSLSVLKKYHYLLNLPKDIDVTDESIIAINKKNILDNIFEKLYETGDSNFTDFIDKYSVKNDGEIRKLILSISQKIESLTDRDGYLDYIENEFYEDENTNTLIEEYIELINNLKEEVKLELENLNYYFDTEYVTKVENVLLPFINADLETLHNYTKIAIPKVPNGSSDESKNAKSKLKVAVDNLLKYNSFGSYESIKNDILSTKSDVKNIVKILRMFFQAYDAYKNKNNIYGFSDIVNMAIKIVRDNDDVRIELKNTFKEIMIDEYQDTNDIQEFFISMISDDNVYMVGDVKQSIYKFRGSNPSIFKDKYNNYMNNIDGYKIDLIKNFRSREEVLNNINQIFNLIMDNSLGGAEYHDTHQMIFGYTFYNEEKRDYNYNLNVLEYNIDEVDNYNKQEIEIFTIGTDIKNKLNNDIMVFDKDSNKLRKATYSDFVVILDRSKYFDLYKKIFEYLNIPLTILRDDSLNVSDDIYIIKNIVDIIIRIHNLDFGKEFKYDFLSIGRSFLYEYSDDYLLDIVMNNNYKNTSIYNDFCNIEDFNSITPSILLDRILKITDFYSKIYKIGDIENIDVRLSNISNMASKLASINMSIVDFRDYLNKIIEDNIDIKYTSFSKPSDTVKIMTIHKSKGLEYPICYFSDLDHEFNTADLNSKFICDKKYGIIVPTEEDNSVIKTVYKDDYIREEIGEKIRLFYVALTRAREKIIIVLPEKDTDKLEKNANGVIEYIRRTKFKKLSDIIYATKNYYPFFFSKIDLNGINLSKDYLSSYSKKTIDNNVNIDEFKVDEINIPNSTIGKKHFSKNLNQLVDKKTKENLLLGEHIHELLEYTDFKNYNPNSIEDVFIRNKISKLLENRLFDNIQDANIYKEYEFSYIKDDINYNGVIDLMLEYDDHIDIVDYKLSNIEDNKYIEQLNGYKKYISSKTNLPINLYLYSIINETLESV